MRLKQQQEKYFAVKGLKIQIMDQEKYVSHMQIQGLVYRIYKELSQSSILENKQFKNMQKTWNDSSQKGYMDGKETHGKMFNVICH